MMDPWRWPSKGCNCSIDNITAWHPGGAEALHDQYQDMILSAEASMDYAHIRGRQRIVRHDRGFGRRCVAGFLRMFRGGRGGSASGHSGFFHAWWHSRR